MAEVPVLVAVERFGGDDAMTGPPVDLEVRHLLECGPEEGGPDEREERRGNGRGFHGCATATAYETGPTWLVTSDTITQYDPALSDPESCGDPLACAVVNEFDRGAQPVSDDVPTASPIVTVVSSVPPGSVSVADVSVTLTVPPPCPTVKLFAELCSAPFTGGSTVPVSTSVVIVCDGAVDDESDEEPEQALVTASAANTSGRTNRVGIIVGAVEQAECRRRSL